MLPALENPYVESVLGEPHWHEAFAVKLRRSFEAMLRSRRSLVFLGQDKEIEDLLTKRGFDERHYCAFTVVSRGQQACLVCIPAGVWSHANIMSVLLEIKQEAASLGKNIMLIPESFVFDKLRGKGPGSQHLPHGICSADRLAVLEHLMQTGRSTLARVASILQHPTPVDAVLQMVVSGMLDIDLDAPIRPATSVILARDH